MVETMFWEDVSRSSVHGPGCEEKVKAGKTSSLSPGVARRGPDGWIAVEASMSWMSPHTTPAEQDTN